MVGLLLQQKKDDPVHKLWGIMQHIEIKKNSNNLQYCRVLWTLYSSSCGGHVSLTSRGLCTQPTSRAFSCTEKLVQMAIWVGWGGGVKQIHTFLILVQYKHE